MECKRRRSSDSDQKLLVGDAGHIGWPAFGHPLPFLKTLLWYTVRNQDTKIGFYAYRRINFGTSSDSCKCSKRRRFSLLHQLSNFLNALEKYNELCWLVNKELIGRLVLALAYTNQNWKIPIPAKYYSKRLCRDLRLIHIRR